MILDEQRGLLVHIEARDCRRHALQFLAHADGRGVHELQRRSARIQQIRQCARRGIQVVEDRDRGGGELGNRHSAEDSLGDEGEGSLGADEQVLEELDRLVEVEEGVQAVAHRVLQPEVAADDVHGLRVVVDPAAQALQSLHELRLLGLELRVGVLVRSVDHRAGRQYERHGFERAVRVEFGATRHAGRVIRDDAADGRSRARGRVRSKLVAPQLQARIDLADCRARLHAHALALVEDLDVFEVAAGIDQNAVTRGLTGQGCAAGAQRHRLSIARGGFEHRGDLGRVFRDDDGLRHLIVVGRIRGVLHALHELRANILGGQGLIQNRRGHMLHRRSSNLL